VSRAKRLSENYSVNPQTTAAAMPLLFSGGERIILFCIESEKGGAEKWYDRVF
jgi:hypothetical protein